MRRIEISQDYTAIVDDGDYDRLIIHKWYALKTKYKVYAQNENHILMQRREHMILQQKNWLAISLN